MKRFLVHLLDRFIPRRKKNLLADEKHIKKVFKSLGVELKPTRGNYLKVLHQRMDLQNNIDPLK